MRKNILFFFLTLSLVLSSTSIFAQLFEENFEYAVGTPITDYNWTSNGNPGQNAILVVEPGLEFPCYAGSGIGNACALGSSGPDAFKFLSRIIDTGSAYVSIMVNITEAQTGDYFFHLSDSSGGFNSDIGRVYAQAGAAGKFAFGLNKTGNNNEIYTPDDYFYNTTYLVLIKYSFVPGASNDLVSLFVFSDCLPFLEPPPTLGPMGEGMTDLPQVGKVTLRQGANSHAPTLIIDGIYVDETWNNSALPVELSGFSASVNNRNVTLNWSTSSELNNSGFEIERSAEGSWNKVAFVNGNGTTTNHNYYTFTDKNLNSGKFNYRLKQVDYNGNFEYHDLELDIVVGTPAAFNLNQNYPNPFNPSTTINFDMPSDGFVTLKVFNTSGKEVATLVNETRTSGYHSVNFNATNLSSGIYYYRLESNGVSKVMKMALIK